MAAYDITVNGQTYRIDGAESPEAAASAVEEMLASAPKAAPRNVEGSFLPLRRDDKGDLKFDSNVGILGALKRAASLPGDVLTGKVDPMSDEGRQRAAEMALTFSPASAGVKAGERAIPGAIKSLTPVKPKAPTADALKAASEQGYRQAREMGVEYSGSSVQGLAGQAQRALESDGILAELSPKTFSILKRLQDAPEGSVATLEGVDAARRALGHAARDFGNPTEQLAAQRVIKVLDGFVEAGDPSSVVAGPAAAASKVITDARGNYAAAKRSDKVTGLEDAAELRASVANSGANVDNAIRQRIASLLLKPKEAAGYSAEEIKLLRAAAEGTYGQNLARLVGNLLGGGGGLGAYIAGGGGAAAGYTAGGLPMALAGLALPLVGAGAKATANRMTRSAVERADEAIRMRSPLYQQMMRDAPRVGSVNPADAVLTRGSMLGLLEAPDERQRRVLPLGLLSGL